MTTLIGFYFTNLQSYNNIDIVAMSKVMIRNKPNTEKSVLGIFFLIDMNLIQWCMFIYTIIMIKYIR